MFKTLSTISRSFWVEHSLQRVMLQSSCQLLLQWDLSYLEKNKWATVYAITSNICKWDLFISYYDMWLLIRILNDIKCMYIKSTLYWICPFHKTMWCILSYEAFKPCLLIDMVHSLSSLWWLNQNVKSKIITNSWTVRWYVVSCPVLSDWLIVFPNCQRL